MFKDWKFWGAFAVFGYAIFAGFYYEDNIYAAYFGIGGIVILTGLQVYYGLKK